MGFWSPSSIPHFLNRIETPSFLVCIWEKYLHKHKEEAALSAPSILVSLYLFSLSINPSLGGSASTWGVR
jgi:hypothetical protein